MTLLSKTECSALRGIAIIGIFLHNYLHWLGQMVQENEYQFIGKNVNGFIHVLAECKGDMLLQLISFFGHYGVPVFLFLSGYGLVLKYENIDPHLQNKEGVWEFVKRHYMKLFPMMLLGFVCFAMVDWMTPGHHHWTWMDLILQMTMTINFFPEPDHIIWPGPYWFFGLMMQLYIIYRLIFFKRDNRWIYGAIILCFFIQLLCIGNPEGEALNRIRYNSIGGILPFGMGILIARYEKIASIKERMEKLLTPSNACGVVVVSIMVIVLGSLNYIAWLWVPAFIVTLHIGVIKLFRGRGLALLDWFGILSSAIFVCHPITRKIFIPISRSGNIVDGLVLYIITTIVLALLFRMIIPKISKCLKL